jgi:hypothetical protein
LIAEIHKNPNAKHVVYDAVSESEALDAFELFMESSYDFSKASLLFLLVQISLVIARWRFDSIC